MASSDVLRHMFFCCLLFFLSALDFRPVEALICWQCDDGAGRCKGPFTPMEHQPVNCDGKCVKIRDPKKQEKRVSHDFVDRRCLTKSQEKSLTAQGKRTDDGCRFMSLGWDKTRKAYYCFCSDGHFCNSGPRATMAFWTEFPFLVRSKIAQRLLRVGIAVVLAGFQTLVRSS